MKLLDTVVLLLGAIQLVLTEHLKISPRSSTFLSKNQLMQFYAKEVNALSRETSIQFYQMSKEILKDPIVQQANTSLMQEFKSNMTQFQEIYPVYMRYGLNKQLLMFFSHTTINYYYGEPTADKDSQYILQLMRKLGYDEIFEQFERNFEKFVLNKFLPKFEEFKNQIPSNETQQFHKLFKWAKEINDCQTYECFYNYFNSFDKLILTPRERLFAYVSQQLRDIIIFYGNNIINIAKGVLKSIQSLQLSPAVRENLIQNLSGYIRKYESTNDTNQLESLLPFFYQNILVKFYNNSDLPAKDRQLLVNIFDAQGYSQFVRNYYKKFKDFVELGLFKRFEYFIASVRQEDISKEKPLLDWYNNFKRLTSYEERNEALKKFLPIENM